MAPQKLHVLSLFDGISCARVALGSRVASYTASEIDEDAIACSSKNWPAIKHVGCVTKIDAAAYRSIDLLVGGSPCQDLSSANPRTAGLGGVRSRLFWEYVRVLHEARPRYFIFENVFSMSLDVRDTITSALGVQPRVINASHFSAQSRKRLFWTNIPVGELPEKRCVTLRDIALGGEALQAEDPHFLAPKDFTPYTPEEIAALRAGTGELAPVGCVRGSAFSTERIYDECGKTPTLRCASREFFKIGPNIRQLVPTEAERLQSLPDGYTASMVFRSKRLRAIGNGFNVDVIRWIVAHIPPTLPPMVQRKRTSGKHRPRALRTKASPEGEGPESKAENFVTEGPDAERPQSIGAEGPEAEGPEAKGPEAKGPEAKGPEAKGPEKPKALEKSEPKRASGKRRRLA